MQSTTSNIATNGISINGAPGVSGQAGSSGVSANGANGISVNGANGQVGQSSVTIGNNPRVGNFENVLCVKICTSAITNYVTLVDLKANR
ncbi:MAG: hypothetical protein DLM72_12515 [Candidatus Nitrosopolaris wilkensis]|nr:MAG: hypothetical protein DLM72_12515 [Candidatus Nitrosopolaris wilkensis]